MRVVLDGMVEGDRFAIMEFNSRAMFWRQELVPVTPYYIQKAISYVERRTAAGGIYLPGCVYVRACACVCEGVCVCVCVCV